jgi:hypothetical protein
MFDTSKEFEITIYSGGPKKCTVGWPSDAEWKRRAKQIRIKQESLSRGRTKSSVIGAEPAALEMFEKIRRDDGSPFDAAEALAIIERLEYCTLQGDEDGTAEIEVLGDRIIVRMGALKHRGDARFHGLVHELRHLSKKQSRDYKLACIEFLPVKGGTEMIQPLDPAEALYNTLVQRVEGYAGAVPVIHKDFVVTQVLEKIRELEDEGDSEE